MLTAWLIVMYCTLLQKMLLVVECIVILRELSEKGFFYNNLYWCRNSTCTASQKKRWKYKKRNKVKGPRGPEQMATPCRLEVQNLYFSGTIVCTTSDTLLNISITSGLESRTIGSTAILSLFRTHSKVSIFLSSLWTSESVESLNLRINCPLCHWFLPGRKISGQMTPSWTFELARWAQETRWYFLFMMKVISCLPWL